MRSNEMFMRRVKITLSELKADNCGLQFGVLCKNCK